MSYRMLNVEVPIEALIISKSGNVRAELKSHDATMNLQMIPQMVADIEAKGCITDRLEVWPGEKWREGDALPDLAICKGHRRRWGLLEGRKTNPAVFDALCASVPCAIMEGATESEFEMRKLDHSSQLSLRNPIEVLRTLKLAILADPTVTELQLVKQFRGLVDQVFGPPKTPKSQAKIEALQEELKAGSRPSDTILKDIDKAWALVYKGRFAGLKHCLELPEVIMASMELKHLKEVVNYDHLKVSQLVANLKQTDVDALAKTFKEECENAPQFNRSKPGPLFLAAWKKLVAGVETDKPATSKSRKVLNEVASKMDSTIVKDLLGFAAGEDVKIDWATMDADLRDMELVREHDPKLWSKVQKSAASIRADQYKTATA